MFLGVSQRKWNIEGENTRKHYCKPLNLINLIYSRNIFSRIFRPTETMRKILTSRIPSGNVMDFYDIKRLKNK